MPDLNIYQAICEYFMRKDEIYLGSSNNAAYKLNLEIAQNKFGFSSESVKAYMTMTENMNNYAYYEPLASPYNNIISTSNSNFASAIKSYVNCSITSTWKQTIYPYQSVIGTILNG